MKAEKLKDRFTIRGESPTGIYRNCPQTVPSLRAGEDVRPGLEGDQIREPPHPIEHRDQGNGQ